MRPPRFFLPLFFLALALAFAPAPAQADLVAYWDFPNGTSPLVDESGHGNALKSLNSSAIAWNSAGKNGGCLFFNPGTSASVYLVPVTAPLTGLPVGNGPYTVSVWVKSNQTASNDRRGIYSWGNYTTYTNNTLRFDSTSGNGLDHYWRNGDLLASGAQVAAAPVVPATNPATYASLTNGTWVHLATRYDGATRAIYVNGTLVASDTPGVNGAVNANFTVGTTDNGTYFSGYLDDLAIWNTALPVAQIQALAANTITPLNGPKLTSFASNLTTGAETTPARLSWTVDTTNDKGALAVSITQGTTTVYSGAAASGSTTVTLPAVNGVATTAIYTLTATDTGSAATVSSAVSVNVVPNVPVATPQSGLAVVAPNTLPITLAGVDPGNAALTYTVVVPPAHGTLTSGTGASHTYTPTGGYAGLDSFTFKVNNGAHDSLPALVSLAAVTTTAPPTALTLSNSVINPAQASGSYVGDFSSADPNPGLVHAYTLVTGTGGTDNAKFTITGHQLRTAQAFAAGVYTIRVRSSNASGLFAENTFTLTAAAPATGKVVINEILYNGQNNNVHDDFIELYNNTGAAVDLSGWSIQDGVSYSFPSGTTLPAGGYLVVAGDPATIHALYPGLTALGPYAGNLSGDGETVTLRDPANNKVCEVDYTPRFPWPNPADGGGASIELLNPNLDPGLGGNWRSSIYPALSAANDYATPGARNAQSLANPSTAPPAVRQVAATPAQPVENVPTVITARITDPDGVGAVTLQYQVVAPGSFLPSTLPNPIVNHLIVGADSPIPANPAFEAAANWLSVPMNDNGVNGDAADGDGLYTVTLPGLPNRTLVRYRITVTDNPGNTIRTPSVDDQSLNFAYFVYNGVPAYQGIAAATLTQLPNYLFLTRKADYDQCVAYDYANQLAGNTSSWTYENWEAAVVYDGVVYDHVMYRLHGANGRYYYTSKRAFRWFFNKGYEFAARDNDGNLYPEPVRHIETENLWENHGTLTYSLNEMINFYLFGIVGVPAPHATMINFRLVDYAAEQADAYHGDYWGMMMVHEDYERQFLDSHNLAKGNLYKLTRDDVTGLSQQRYQGPFAVTDGSDHDAIYNNTGATRLTGQSTPAYVTSHVNLPEYDRYHALAEAIRHYDYWPSGDNNGAYYFDPNTYTADNNYHGQLWMLPSDTDATWGPTWNNGHDVVHNALFNDSGDTGGDASTNPSLWPGFFNAIREVRDLLWQPDQINPLVDQYAAIISAQQAADDLRWKNAPADAGNYNGLAGAGITSIANLVADMKNFAFSGGSWPGGDVGAGGRAAWLDTLQLGVSNSEATMPGQPTLTYVGSANYPINNLTFQTSAFAPQAGNTFAAMQWRVGEVTDPTAPAYVAGQKALLEWNASYDSGPLTTYTSQFRFPAYAAKAGHTYRARVRHQDSAGRWSHWSAPVQFTAVAADVTGYTNSLVVSEFMYYPTNPTTAESAAGYVVDNFQYLEVTNVSAVPVDLTDVRLTKGVNFNFPSGMTLAAGASTVVVANAAAFAERYGSGRSVAGAWDSTQSLAHKGEEIKLSYGSGQAIIDFTYTNAAPWPTIPSGSGYSAVLINPAALPDPTNPANWRKSYAVNGNPGGSDTLTYAWWSAAYPGVAGNPTGSLTGNGLSNLLVYALGGNPTVNNPGLLPRQAIQPLSVNGVTGNYLTLVFRHQGDSQDITYHVEFSPNLAAWSENGTLVSSVSNGDGTYTQTWRAATPNDGTTPVQFARLRITRP